MELGSIMLFRRKYYRLESVADISISFRSVSAKGKTSIVSSHDRVSCFAIVQDELTNRDVAPVITCLKRK
jgi:hypothetical protein